MDFKQIQELIKMINKSNIGEVTIEQKDFKVTIKQKEEKITQIMGGSVQSSPIVHFGAAACQQPATFHQQCAG
ncbi:MAG: hypothetical protein WDN26_02850 [Chitinophagaceae bacterium]